ncbi:unnamed protein product [Psylliodes chrysocephalus]|uniref:Centromere protein X n=1 Tax=Psylliodes chrysocephalus TaxID=3402493 RepID=A0A9P0D595_9CUCU|nr:unnamed protein product [Psylliodes chrysocephala]
MDADECANKTPLDNIQTNFQHDIIKQALKTRFNNPKNKITEDAIELISDLAKVLATEAAVRAIKQAKSEYKTKVQLEHVEAVLPQLPQSI